MLPDFVISNLLKYSKKKISSLLEKEIVNPGDFVKIDYIATSLLDPAFVYTRSIKTWKISATLDTLNPEFILINSALIDGSEIDQEQVNNSVIEYIAIQELKELQ